MGEVRADGLQVGMEFPSLTHKVTWEKMVEFERVVWDRGLNSHNDPEKAKAAGLSRPIASGQNQMAFIHAALERHFGDSWVYGGRISSRWISPVYEGDSITTHLQVKEISEENGQIRVVLDIWNENENGVKTAVATAWAAPPTDKRSWLEGGVR